MSLKNLLNLLTHGFSNNKTVFNPTEVLEAAELLGIEVGDVTICGRQEMENVDAETLENPNKTNTENYV